MKRAFSKRYGFNRAYSVREADRLEKRSAGFSENTYMFFEKEDTVLEKFVPSFSTFKPQKEEKHLPSFGKSEQKGIFSARSFPSNTFPGGLKQLIGTFQRR